jgi:hypothetical protein
MLGLLRLSIALAVSHHILYRSLDGKPARTREGRASKWATQEWIGKYGVTFAFLTKTLLAGSVVANKQYIWTSLQRPYSVFGINAMYNATTDISSFGNWEFLGGGQRYLLFLQP